MTSTGTPSKALDIPQDAMINKLLRGELELPDAVTRVINVQGWARSLIARDDYAEPDPDYLSRMLLLQTLTSSNIDEVFSQSGIKSLQKSIPNIPGAGTGPIRIDDLYVTDSDFGEGAKTYLILGTTSMLHGTVQKYTTGAQQVQAQTMAALCLGVWPIECEITRTERKDKGGNYMFWLLPPDTSDAPF
jgi:hypothetical protein